MFLFRPATPSDQGFVLISHPRTGSSMILKALRAHPKLMVFGELYHPTKINFLLPGFDGTDPKLIAERDANPIAFLKTRVYAPALAEGKTVGYKLHVEQIEQKRVLFGYLKANRSLKIIQLTRRNFLAETASRLIAKRTGRWHIEDESQRSTETVEIPFKLLLKNYRHLLSLDEKIRRLTRHHARMELTYEDFVSAPDLWLNKIQEHIGVNPLPLEIRTVKQETRPLNEIITNFEELRRQAKGTPLAFLFQA